MTKRDVVIVVWDDARGDKHTEVEESSLPHRPTVNTTLGWLLRDDDAGVSLVTEHVADGDATCYRGHDFIPRGMVRSVTHFKLQSVRKPRAKSNSVPAPDTPV